jgi:FKBP-type peptidyl-prolyl cis-trans isomerase
MKKILSFAIVAMTCAVLFTACNKNKFKKTENGLLYRFETIVSDGQQPNAGDLLVGELILRLENDTLFTNVGHPDRIFQVAETPMFKGDIQEGLLMMHVGDKAVFKIAADSVAKFMQPGQMPRGYQSGKGQYLYYEIVLNDIVTKDELAQEQANFMQEMEQRKTDEPAAIQKYIADNNITAKPTKSGLYVIVKKKGTGAKVATGKKVAIDYTGRLLDGTIFDTSREADAKAANKYMEGREYKPLEYVVGAQSMIKGWEEGVMGQPAGSEITLVIPSELAYGPRGAGQDIMPYSPLTFDLTIVSVE